MDNAGESLMIDIYMAEKYMLMYGIKAVDTGRERTSSYLLYPALAVGFLPPFSLFILLRTWWY